jgi:predicted nuclease of predicted toxin-antitoxin system
VLADENLDNAIVGGLLRRSSRIDIVRAQDVPQISGGEDTVVLDWATRDDRVLLTHDVSTMIPAMRDHLRIVSLPLRLVSGITGTGSRWLASIDRASSNC